MTTTTPPLSSRNRAEGTGERRATPSPTERGDLETLTKPKTETRPPRLYSVVLHNDDFTTMEFVVWVLVHLFERTVEEATQLMLDVHQRGAARVGAYTREVAETKRDETMRLAEQQEMPLLVTIEPAES